LVREVLLGDLATGDVRKVHDDAADVSDVSQIRPAAEEPDPRSVILADPEFGFESLARPDRGPLEHCEEVVEVIGMNDLPYRALLTRLRGIRHARQRANDVDHLAGRGEHQRRVCRINRQRAVVPLTCSHTQLGTVTLA
jgi:hypothetical protein